ncbi:MAG TPA: hypothetical protein VMV23_11980 [Candidatus Nanopelagicaceae bacterium]|nr:hypothetical protein [Candidatus Nanopelagicaceae bacterium]
MSKLLYVEPTDEITDLVDRIRRAEGERDLVFVLPPGGRVLRSPLDAQLLMQYTRGFQKRVAIVAAEPQVQALAIRAGFPTFPTVSRLEQGMPLTSAPSAEELAAAAALVAVAEVASERQVAPTGRPTEALSRRSPSALVAAEPAVASGGHPSRGFWHTRGARNWAIGAGAAIFVVGVLAVLLLLPTATVLVGVQAHQLTDNVTIQGSAGSQAANVLDVIPTQALLTPDATQTFTVTPSGTQVLPPTPATGDLYLCYNGGKQSGAGTLQLTFTGSAAAEFQDLSGNGNLGFTPTSAGANGTYSVQPCSNGAATAQTSSPALPVQADANSLGTQGNMAAGQQWFWAPANEQASACLSPASAPGLCVTGNFTISLANPQGMAGGQNSTNQSIFSSSDVASAQQQEQQIAASLTAKVEQSLKSMAGSGVIAQDSSGNGIQLTVTDPTIPTVGQAGQAETLTVSVNAAATAYSPKAARAAVLADLKSKVPSDGALLPNPKIGALQVIAAGPGGSVTLSSAAVGYWAPRVDLHPYRSKVTFMSPGAARSFLLSQLPGASTVVVHQSPFALPWLPLLSSRIQIVRVSIAGSSSTA